jgi:hypothetical protein
MIADLSLHVQRKRNLRMLIAVALEPWRPEGYPETAETPLLSDPRHGRRLRERMDHTVGQANGDAYAAASSRTSLEEVVL